jgi:hypothetical protein
MQPGHPGAGRDPRLNTQIGPGPEFILSEVEGPGRRGLSNSYAYSGHPGAGRDPRLNTQIGPGPEFILSEVEGPGRQGLSLGLRRGDELWHVQVMGHVRVTGHAISFRKAQ